MDYIGKYRALPTDSTLRNAFPEWAPADGDLQFWTDEMVKLTTAQKAQRAIMRCLETMTDPGAAVQELIRNLQGIKHASAKHIVASDAGIGARIARYMARREEAERTGGRQVFGITTLFDQINASHIGWMPGELVGVYARPTVGKTWFLVAEATNAWMQGRRILFISPEMPTGRIELRFDAFLAAALQLPFSHRLAYSGDPILEQSYRQLGATVGEHSRWYTVDSVNGEAVSVADIKRLAAEFEPDIIFIDGVSLVRGERKTSEWEIIKSIIYALKLFSTHSELPVIVTHQAKNQGRRAEKDLGMTLGHGDDWTMPSLNDAYGGDGFVQGCETVITMCPDQTYSEIRWYSIRKVRERDLEFRSRCALAWDVDKGIIRDLSMFRETTDAVMEARRIIGERRGAAAQLSAPGA